MCGFQLERRHAVTGSRTASASSSLQQSTANVNMVACWGEKQQELMFATNDLPAGVRLRRYTVRDKCANKRNPKCSLSVNLLYWHNQSVNLHRWPWWITFWVVSCVLFNFYDHIQKTKLQCSNLESNEHKRFSFWIFTIKMTSAVNPERSKSGGHLFFTIFTQSTTRKKDVLLQSQDDWGLFRPRHDLFWRGKFKTGLAENTAAALRLTGEW